MKDPKQSPYPPRVCIFCGGAPVTAEHIWSEWTYQYIPRRKGKHSRRTLTDAAGAMRLTRQRIRSGEVNTVKITAVCRKCNTGWMSELEAAAKPHLVPLFLGTAHVLHPFHQRLVAAWIVMKCMIIEWDENVVVSTQEERDFLRLNLTPPDRWRVFLASHATPRWRTGWLRIAVGIRPTKEVQDEVPRTMDKHLANNTQAFTLGFQRLLIHANFTRHPRITLNPIGALRPMLCELWPVREGILWPNTNVLPSIGIDALATALYRFTEHGKRIVASRRDGSGS